MTATGNEVNAAWVDAANPHCRGALSAEPLEDVLAKLGYEVDLFFSSHVLEHVADPDRILALIARHLSARGVAYLCVPNAHSLRAMIGGRRNDSFYQFPMHLNYFTPKSLCAMLRAVGLRAIQIETRVLDEVAPDGRSPIDRLMRIPPNMQVDYAAWGDAACANLLGGGLFVLAARHDNTAARRAPDLERKVELAFRVSWLAGVCRFRMASGSYVPSRGPPKRLCAAGASIRPKSLLGCAVLRGATNTDMALDLSGRRTLAAGRDAGGKVPTAQAAPGRTAVRHSHRSLPGGRERGRRSAIQPSSIVSAGTKTALRSKEKDAMDGCVMLLWLSRHTARLLVSLGWRIARSPLQFDLPA